MRKGHLVTILIFVAMIAVFVISSYSRTHSGQHGDRTAWIQKHAEVIQHNGNPQAFCLKCHEEQRGENLDNFCNKCHQESGVPPVDLNKLQKRG